MTAKRDPPQPDHHREPGPWSDETARWYAEEWGEHETNRMCVQVAKLRADDIVVDIGCGTGSAVRAAALEMSEGRVYGIDPTPEMIRIAKEQSADAPGAERMQFLEGDSVQLPLDDASVTVALANNSLHHWNDVAGGLVEAHRVLRPGGRLFVTDEIDEEDEDDAGEHETRWKDPVEIGGALEAAGFADIEAFEHTEGDVRMSVVRAVKPTS